METGWPLGLQPLSARVGFTINYDRDGSTSFSTLFTGSCLSLSSSFDSSSDLETESTGSFFRDKSISLGSLIGGSNFLELSTRSTRQNPAESSREKKGTYKSKPWLFSLCSKMSTDAVSTNNNTPSLAHFLEAERKAASIYRRNRVPLIIGPDNLSLHHSGLSSLLIGVHVPPPHSSSWLNSNGGRRSHRIVIEHGSGH